MNQWTAGLAVAAMLAAATSGAKEPASLERIAQSGLAEGRDRAATLDALYDGKGLTSAPPAVRVPRGIKKGAQEGALLGFYSGIAPAASMIDAGFTRSMSRHYDGARSDNGHADLYYYTGIALGVLLYIPALILGMVGGGIGAAVGGASEAARPGSTERWDAERLLFDRRKR